MVARLRPVWVGAFLAACGCLPEKDSLPLVATSPFGSPPPVAMPTKVSHAPASEQAATRVLQVGQKILAANKEAGLRPMLLTIGSPTPEVFHRGTSALFVTEGLTNLCQTEEQLAAVLALEMGRMVAEREALAVPSTRRPELEPPTAPRVGNDYGGTFGPSDGTRLAELAKFEQAGGRPSGAPAPPLPPPPKPETLACRYLEKAGYKAKDLDSAEPVLRAARANVALERQLAGAGAPTKAVPSPKPVPGVGLLKPVPQSPGR
jgi:hypothetical protein